MLLVAATLISLPFYYLSLEIAKTIVNRVLLAESGNVLVFLQIPAIGTYAVPARVLLIELCSALLASVLAYELLKMLVNICKGVLTERVIAYMRRSILAAADDPAQRNLSRLHGRLIPMVVMEPEPIGGFCGEILALPAVQGGALATALVFIFVQDAVLGLAALMCFPLQVWIFPKLVARRTALELARVEHLRSLSRELEREIQHRIPSGNASDNARLSTPTIEERIDALCGNRIAFYINKFFTYFFLNFANHFTPFLFYAIGGWFVLQGQVTIGALVAVIAAYRDLTPPWEELLYWWQDSKVAVSRYRSLIHELG